jgi:hypothetical protein
MAQICLIYNLLREVDVLESVMRAMLSFVFIFLVLYFYRLINSRMIGYQGEGTGKTGRQENDEK